MPGGGRATFERYLEAFTARDFATLRALAHPNFEDAYPQSGEVTVGIENLIAIVSNYPGDFKSLGRDRIVGGEDRYVRTPHFTVIRVEGSGDQFTGIQRALYPDGSVWFVVLVAEIRDGLVYRTESYFAPTFDPPSWRAPYVRKGFAAD
jgi:hypothetical protein